MLSGMKGVLFDNDGTLVDSREMLLATFRYATRTVLGRIVPDEDLMRGVGIPLAQQMGDFTDDPAEAQELLRVYRAYNRAIHDDMIAAFDGVPELLADLRRAGMRLGVVTSKMHDLAWHGLEVVGIAHHFDFLVAPDTWHETKPAPGPVLRGCELLDMEPALCAYVGDSPYDMQAGNAAGVATAAVLWGMFGEDELAAERPDAVCATVEDLACALGVA